MSRSEVTTEGSNLWAMTDALKGPHLQRLKQGDRTPENRKQRAGRVIQMDLWSRARPAVWQPPTGGELGVGRYRHKPLEQSSIGALANWATGKAGRSFSLYPDLGCYSRLKFRRSCQVSSTLTKTDIILLVAAYGYSYCRDLRYFRC